MMLNNPAVKGKRAEIQASSYTIDSLKAKRYPSIAVQSAYLEDGTTQGVLSLQQPLWAFGRIDNPIARGEAQYQSEQLDLLRVVRGLMEETALAYVQIETLRKRERLAAESVAEQQRLYEQIERRQHGQLASESDVLLASSRLAQAAAQQQQIAGELRIAENRLYNLTRTTIDTTVPVEAAMSKLAGIEHVEQAAMENSADILFKRSEVDVAVKSISEERTSAMPTLYVGVEQQLLDVAEGVDDTVVSIGIEAALDGVGLAVSGRTKSAASKARAAQQDLAATRNDVQQRVRSLWDNRSLQKTLLESQEQSVIALANTMSSYERQYAAGRKSWLEVLNIQRELAQQKLQRAQIEGEWLRLSLQLAIMTGSLDYMVGIDLGKE